MPAPDAAAALAACSSCSRWVDALLRQRPYASREAVLAAADAEWSRLEPNDWREAIAGHPRIGERGATPMSGRSRAWSGDEQSAAQPADAWVKLELARLNAEYESRFGHIFIVAASGKSAEEILAICRSRIGNGAERELAIVGGELREIALLRLRKLLGAEETAQP